MAANPARAEPPIPEFGDVHLVPLERRLPGEDQSLHRGDGPRHALAVGLADHDATCGSSSTACSDAPMQKNVTRSGRYINAAEVINVINVVDLPRCAVATTMMLSISVSMACTRWACSSGMSTIPTGNTSPGFWP